MKIDIFRTYTTNIGKNFNATSDGKNTAYMLTVMKISVIVILVNTSK